MTGAEPAQSAESVRTFREQEVIEAALEWWRYCRPRNEIERVLAATCSRYVLRLNDGGEFTADEIEAGLLAALEARDMPAVVDLFRLLRASVDVERAQDVLTAIEIGMTGAHSDGPGA